MCMTKKEFLRLALLFTATNEKFASLNIYVWTNTLREHVSALLTLAEELKVIDEPDKPP